MRSKFALLAAVTLMGCSEDEPTPVNTVEDAVAETIGIDTSTPVDSAMDTFVADTGAFPLDSGAADTREDSTTTETAVDSALVDTAVVDSAVVDTAAVDSAVLDSSSDVLDTAVDATFAAAPTCDGTIGSAEYGVHVDGKNQYTHTTTSTKWYVTWDDTSLYVAIAVANVGEGAVVYVDANLNSPPTSGTDADGNTSGQTYDSTRFTTMPFRANLVAYAKEGYREYRTADGSGGWSSPTTSFGCFASSGTTREFSIPWSALGGRPSSFGFLGYVTSAGGTVYGEAPMANPEGLIGTSATATSYFHVGATGPTATSNAFADPR